MTQAYSYASHRAAKKLRQLSDADLKEEICKTENLVALWAPVPKISRVNYYQRKLKFLLELEEERGL